MGLSAEAAKGLNQQFYDDTPWTYFRRRLIYLMENADPDRELYDDGDLTLNVGRVSLRLTSAEEEPYRNADISPEATAHFVAAEGEVLLHHLSETLLRLALAHVPDRNGRVPACPWIEIVRRRDFGRIRADVQAHFVGAVGTDAQREKMRFLFGASDAADDGDAERLDLLAGYLEYFATIYLDDNDAYNAAKHGFVMKAGMSRFTLRRDGTVEMEETDTSVSHLHNRRADRRWCLDTCLYSIEATVALGWLAVTMMGALWMFARGRYLGAPVPEPCSPPSLREVLGRPTGDIRRWVVMSANYGHYDTSGRRDRKPL